MSFRRPRGLFLGALVAGSALLSITSCGGADDDPADAAAAALATRAATGIEARYTATYALETDATSGSTATVVREPLRIRLDVETTNGVATSIRDAGGIVSCQQARDARTTCLVVAEPGEEADPAFDPSLRRVFGEVLQVFADQSEELDVEIVDEPSAAVPAAGPDADVACFRVGGEPPEPVVPGTYCLTADGVPTRIAYETSSATLTDLAGPPDADAFRPPAPPQPLPPDA